MRRSWREGLWAAALFVAATGAACQETTGEQAPRPAAAEVEAPAVALPEDAHGFAPSQVLIAGGGRRSGAEIADVDRCEPCHAEVVRAWRSSAHALASFTNPLYRVSVEGFREARGNETSRFCGGCHDPALLVDGAMDDEVAAADPRAAAGVTCSVCHTVVEARPGGNGSYTLAADPLPVPDLGDAASIAEHKRLATRGPLRTAGLCGTCHKAFLGEHTGHPHFISGADDMLPWKRSAFAGSHAERVDDPVARAACKDCHMPLEPPLDYDAAGDDGALASHRFAGAHTLLAAMGGDRDQLDASASLLRGAASVDVAVVRSASASGLPEEVAAAHGAEMQLDVVVRNLGVGHLFPGGTVDIADTWLEVEVLDADDTVIAYAGADHAEGRADAAVHRLRAEIVDEDGLPVRAHEVERFRAVAYNHAVPARDAAVVTYAFVVPEGTRLPLAVRVRLRHRSRTLELSEAACRAQQTPSGRAFAAVAGLDACVRPPIVDVAARRVVLGAGEAVLDPARLAARLADHGQAMLRGVQEELDLARPSLERARTLSLAAANRREEVRALYLLGELESRQGRVDEALRRFDEAGALLEGHPAVAAGKGRALAAVWRFDQAIDPFAEAARGAPLDDAVWAYLAMSRASAGDPEGARTAAFRGLAQAPRNADLLRSQALAMRKLAPGDPSTREADEAHLRHRVADDAPALRAACGARVASCALERKPVHVHPMTPAHRTVGSD